MTLHEDDQIHNSYIIMRRLRKHVPMLKTLAHAKPHMRKAIIKSAGTSLITCLCDCVYNTLKGKVNMSKHQYRKIRRHKNDLRALNNSRTTADKKRIIQSGGFLGALLRPILGVLGSILID